MTFTPAELRLLALSDQVTDTNWSRLHLGRKRHTTSPGGPPMRTCPTKPGAKPENVARRAYFRERWRKRAEAKRRANATPPV